MAKSKPAADHIGAPSRNNSKILSQLVVGGALLLLLVFIIKITSSSPDETVPFRFPPQAANENQTEAASQPASQPVEPERRDPFQVRVSISTLADPQSGWLSIKWQSVSTQNSSATARYIADNELSIDTENVEEFQVDLTELPIVPGRNLVVHVDGQNMKVALRNRKIITFTRSPRGRWFTVRK